MEGEGDLTPAVDPTGAVDTSRSCSGGTLHRRCFTKECVRNSVRYEYKTSYEKKLKTNYEEVMEKDTRKKEVTR